MTPYDEWLTTTPEDEQAAADAREARRSAPRAEPGRPYPHWPSSPDSVAESLAESARLAKLLGQNWTEGLPI